MSLIPLRRYIPRRQRPILATRHIRNFHPDVALLEVCVLPALLSLLCAIHCTGFLGLGRWHVLWQLLFVLGLHAGVAEQAFLGDPGAISHAHPCHFDQGFVDQGLVNLAGPVMFDDVVAVWGTWPVGQRGVD